MARVSRQGRNEPVVDEPQAQNLIGLASRRGVIAAADLEVRRDIVRNVFVELRSAVAGGGLLLNDGAGNFAPPETDQVMDLIVFRRERSGAIEPFGCRIEIPLPQRQQPPIGPSSRFSRYQLR